MKPLTLALALSAAVAAQIPVVAAPILGTGVGGSDKPVSTAPTTPSGPTVPVEARQIQVNARPPIPFKPFPLADLKTGQPLSPDAIITLRSGRKMKASAYFAQLNQLEQQFNAIGYSLRQPGTINLQVLRVDQQQLQSQMAILQALPPAPKPVVGLLGTFRPAGAAHVAAVSPVRGIVANPFGSVASMNRNWDYVYGSKDTLGAELVGQINLNGTDQGLSASGLARASAAILGNEWDLIRVSGNLNAPKTGAGSAKLNLYVVGIGDTPLLDQALNRPVFSTQNSVTHQLDVHQDFTFPVGPIPVHARLGARGGVGVQYGITVQTTGINVSLTPQVQVDAYGQADVDLLVASAGIGADLALLHDSLHFGAEGGLTTDGGVPALNGHCYATDSLEALSGRLYAYVKVDLLFTDKEWDWDIWDFGGFRKDVTLFDDAKTVRFTPRQPVATQG